MFIAERSNRQLAGSVVSHFSGQSQNAKVLLHLIKRGTITQVEAHELYRVYRLASRIYDLSSRGVSIVRRTKLDPTGRRYVEYSLSPG